MRTKILSPLRRDGYKAGMIMMLIALSTMMLTTACSSEDDALNNTTNTENTINKGYALPVTVNVTREGDAGTRATFDGSKLAFSAGDKLFVEGSHIDADRFAGTLTWQSGGTFSGTIYTESPYEGTIDDLLNGNYATLLPAGYESYDYLEIIDEGYEARLGENAYNSFATSKKLAVEQLSFEHGEYTIGTGFELEPQKAILNFTITGLTASTKVTAALSDDEDWTPDIEGEVTTDGSGNATFAIGLEDGSDLNEFSLTVAGNAITLVSSSKMLEAGKIYNITRTPGVLNGQFSVSSTKKVFFSKGNLQYDGTNWKFAASQWEVLGANGTGAIGTATNYPMDLFTWGNIDSPTYDGTTYYTEDADLSGITDWGSRMGSGWYTLSKDECLYLFGMESNNTDKNGHARYRKYFRAKVNGVSGIVVLPDELSGISDIPAESSRGTASTFNGKTYTTDAWSAMESAGCVFLPAAGFRLNGTSVMNVGSSGFYWPSTANGSGSAFTVGFDKDNVFPANNFNRNIGFSVRLVRPVPSN